MPQGPAAAAAWAEAAGADADAIPTLASDHFLNGKRTCCESILLAGCQALGVNSDLVRDIALGLAGGVGMQGGTCGVLTGSALVLSLAVAKKEPERAKRVAKTMEAVGRVYQGFQKQCGHTDCRSLSGFDLTTPEGKQRLKSVRVGTCANYVRVGARLLALELRAL